MVVTEKASISRTKIPFDLTVLATEYSDFLSRSQITNQPFTSFKPAIQSFQTTPNGAIFVDAVASGNVTNLLDDLKRLGLQNFAAIGSIVSGSIPITALAEVANLASLKFLNPVYRPITNVGLTTSQGDVAAAANLARNNLGLTGVGATVGVLSDSFNKNAAPITNASQDITNGDLPGAGNPNGFLTAVNVLDDSASGSLSDEGRAMLQIIHDLAPGAKLAFHTAFTGIANFAQGIIDLKDAGSTVIVDDVFNLGESFFQDGPIAQAVNTVVAAGVPYFSSAGNSARKSYQSAFNNYGTTFANGQIPLDVANGNTNPGGFFGGIAHDFDPGIGVDVLQKFTLAAGRRIFISFQWDDPFASVSPGFGATRDLDIYVLNAAGNSVVGGQATSNIGRDALEVFSFTNTGAVAADFNLLILRESGTGFPNIIKYIDFGSENIGLEFDSQSYTIVGHANAAGAAAVGAAFYGQTPAFGQTPPLLEPFSSVGTTSPSILFTTTGAATSQVRQKPEFTAPDGGNTSFFGNDIGNFNGTDPDNFPNFFGTSASAPHAAAVAALIQQAVPNQTPAQIYDALKNTAINIGVPGFDLNSGFGLINAQAAINSLPRNQINGTINRESLTGTNGLDLITGGSGADTLTGGLAQDIFIYNSNRDAGDLISGFQTEIDKLDFRGLANSLGQLNQNLISLGFLSFATVGSDTRILLDNDGTGTGFVPRPFALVQNITPTALNVANNFIFS